MIGGEVVLLIEDNEANAMLASAILERAGFQVEVAASAAEARRVLRTMVPAVILMDVQLPGEDGLELTRELKSSRATAPTPIIALTAHAMSGDRERTLEAGCVAYVSKPIDTRTFASRIREVLDGSRHAQKEAAAS